MSFDELKERIVQVDQEIDRLSADFDNNEETIKSCDNVLQKLVAQITDFDGGEEWVTDHANRCAKGVFHV